MTSRYHISYSDSRRLNARHHDAFMTRSVRHATIIDIIILVSCRHAREEKRNRLMVVHPPASSRIDHNPESVEES